MKTKFSVTIALTVLLLLIGTASQYKVDASIPDLPQASYATIHCSYVGASDYCCLEFRGQFDDGGSMVNFGNDDSWPYSFTSTTLYKPIRYCWVYLQIRASIYGPVYYCSGCNNCCITKTSAWFGQVNGTINVSASIDFDDQFPLPCPY